jgi:phosphoserine phosphatase RsbU/P
MGIAAANTSEAPIDAGWCAAEKLHCMEVWGGSRPRRTSIAMPGLDAWVFSQPFGHDSAQATATSGGADDGADEDHADADEVEGGDIHYISSCVEGRLTRFLIADVAGHGPRAADLSRALRRLMRRHINTPDQSAFARTLNEHFTGLGAAGRFATAVLLTYFSPTQHLVVVNAGHPQPLWYRAAAKQWQVLDHAQAADASGPSNLPLGVIHPTTYHQFVVPLEPDDLVLAYTDALIEAAAPAAPATPAAQGVAPTARRALGIAGLLNIARSLPADDPAAAADRLVDAVAAHRGHRPADDDQTFVLLRHTGYRKPQLSMGEHLHALARLIGLENWYRPA